MTSLQDRQTREEVQPQVMAGPFEGLLKLENRVAAEVPLAERVNKLAKGQYIDNRENVLLIGSSGVGKTRRAIALGLAACGQGRKVRFFRVTELITLLVEA